VDSRYKDSYKEMDFYANHPRYETDSAGKKVLIPADDHKKVMIEFVQSAKSGDRLYFNFYDFDLEELADALIDAKKRGVEVLGGVDKDVVKTKETANAVYKKIKVARIDIEAIDSTGLNHQKLMALISKDGRSKTLMSSGNPTQSCSGAEGDLKDVPANQRPEHSIPNPNNMIVVDGEIPAVIAAAEIKKNIVYKLRGQAEFPIGGAYQLLGPRRPGYKNQDWMIMAFSPNGGLGDINRDIYSRVVKLSSGPIYGAFFSFSSETLALELTQKIVEEIKLRRKTGKPAVDLVKFVGDSRFAMRDFSILLKLSGYRVVEYDPKDPFKPIANNGNTDPEKFEKPDKKDLVKVYVDDPSEPISKPIRDLLTKDEWENFRENIRINASWFSETEFEYGEKKLTYEVKLHDKLILFLRNFISNPGSSVNFSDAGKSNQEQIAIVFSEYIAQKVSAVVDYLFNSYSDKRSVTAEAIRRNENNTPEEIRIGLEVLKFREKQKAESTKASTTDEKTKKYPERNLNLTCPMVFAK
jgi:hypothetical protein